MNRMSYVYSSQTYWTMSSSRYHGDSSYSAKFIFTDGYLHEWADVSTAGGVRPVINLSKDVEITGGIGTSSDPFVVKI